MVKIKGILVEDKPTWKCNRLRIRTEVGRTSINRLQARHLQNTKVEKKAAMSFRPEPCSLHPLQARCGFSRNPLVIMDIRGVGH